MLFNNDGWFLQHSGSKYAEVDHSSKQNFYYWQFLSDYVDLPMIYIKEQ